MLSSDPAAVEARLRAACLALPETAEKISHGIPAFSVAGKMFAYFRHNHHGDGMTVVCVKTTGRDEQEFLIEADPEIHSRPAYLWPSGWVGISLADDADWDLVEARLRSSWALAAPRRLTG
ncbi:MULTISPECIES: MmcQ/YjbR family DNA-binding protein [unclassified Phenylobacterium]|uniref:MmcQ/YjbR family DNA-binding protein n=1 Tax=unclassified Phenylobacterium TaxID=2640670 RepID=UPI00083B48F6|nr:MULTISPECIES: MmcQ/YjbR family DNA-binding protein [unclassified Phenylobacterium]